MFDVPKNNMYTFVFLFDVNYHAVEITCQNVHIFKRNQLDCHTSHKVPVQIYMNIIIRLCTVPVEFWAALLFLWLCRFVFGDCLPLSLALHHLPPSNLHKSCNRNTHFCSTAHLNQTNWSHYTPKTSVLYLRWRPQLSPKHTGACAQLHNRNA